MSHEAHFLFSGHVSKQSSCFLEIHNSQLIYETSLHPLKTTVWCGIHAGNIIGPYFLENNQDVAVTVTAEQYQDMIRKFLVPEIEEQGLEDMWFQQDGATVHTARSTIIELRYSTKTNFAKWRFSMASRISGFNITRLFLMGFFKSKIYVNKLQNDSTS
ncbi:hypothetical protein GWI33_008080 [Rhynchophorus ferrugineus]|uniref:Transposase n=1 Tax=Rhynchophorus ferrugineus TaxID=354439 RepID=A0A834IH70_RHYFE|nr:hypothetical protein GWI33_008080 [Rhynchophorus ferrugineus]